jgi:hypothetical protein
VGDEPWRDVAAGGTLHANQADHGTTHVLIGKPAWLALDDREAPEVVELSLDGQALDPARAADLGWIDPPKQARVALRDAANPLAQAALEVTLNGAPLGPDLSTVEFSPDRRRVAIGVDLEKATAGERNQPRRHTLIVAVSDQAVRPHAARLRLSYLAKTPLDPAAIYLSDLPRLRAFAHGGPNLDRDYGGDVATIGDRVYPKCIMVCPEPSPQGAHGEVVFEVPAKAPRRLHSDIGIEDMAKANGSAVFMVQRGDSPDGPWETLYTSPTMRGGVAAVTIAVGLGDARFLRLYTTDAGDGINSDHALWGNARLALEP